MADKSRIIAAAGFLIFAALALTFFSRAGITPEFTDSIILKVIDLSLAQKMDVNFAYLTWGLIFLPLSFAFLVAFALLSGKVDWALLIPSLAISGAMLFFNGLGSTNIAAAAGVFLFPLITQYVAVDDMKAYKELRPGRIASNATGKALLALSILAALSVFSVTSSDTSYSEKAVDGLVNATLVMAIDESSADVKTLAGGGELFNEKIRQIKAQVKSMPVFGVIRQYFPHVSAVTVFASIQFAAIIMSALAGIYASIIWRIARKPDDAGDI